MEELIFPIENKHHVYEVYEAFLFYVFSSSVREHVASPIYLHIIFSLFLEEDVHVDVSTKYSTMLHYILLPLPKYKVLFFSS